MHCTSLCLAVFVNCPPKDLPPVPSSRSVSFTATTALGFLLYPQSVRLTHFPTTSVFPVGHVLGASPFRVPFKFLGFPVPPTISTPFFVSPAQLRSLQTPRHRGPPGATLKRSSRDPSVPSQDSFPSLYPALSVTRGEGCRYGRGGLGDEEILGGGKQRPGFAAEGEWRRDRRQGERGGVVTEKDVRRRRRRR